MKHVPVSSMAIYPGPLQNNITFGNKHLFSLCRVRQNIDKNLALVDPDPEKCYTKAMRLQCASCSQECPSSSNLSEKEQFETGEWTKSAATIPKSFSFINIKNYTMKSSKKESTVEKPLDKGYKFFYENYVFGVQSKAAADETGNVYFKAKCYRSQ